MSNRLKVEVTVDVTAWAHYKVDALRDFVVHMDAGTATPPEAGDASESEGAAVAIVPRSWTPTLFDELMDRLVARGGLAQAKAIRHAVTHGGVIDRDTVYALSDWDPSARSLRGFTRTVDNVVTEMATLGLLPADADRVLVPHYEGPGKARWFTVADDLIALRDRIGGNAA